MTGHPDRDTEDRRAEIERVAEDIKRRGEQYGINSIEDAAAAFRATLDNTRMMKP